MPDSIFTFLNRLTSDPWREKIGFSSDVELVNQVLFDPESSDEICQQAINDWMKKYQPCFFGRLAAKLNNITYCLLRESDLHESDEFIGNKIQACRTRWTCAGFEGKSSAFVVLVISPKIANAVPNENVKLLAQKLCSLYLLTEVDLDTIYLEEIFLEKPGPRKTTWKWDAGVNYFSSQGDGRWWQDHKVPGGIAFSVNSIGHLIKSNILGKSMKELANLMDAPQEEFGSGKILSSADALQFAMLTIDNASESVSGKATELLPLPSNPDELPIRECPIKPIKGLEDKNFCEYKGWYHTDVTLPSEYFWDYIERPSIVNHHVLDFTYLFDKSEENPDLTRIFRGRQIRSWASDGDKESKSKEGKVEPSEVFISESPHLVSSLGKKES